MPSGQASITKKNSKVAASQPSPKRAREHRSDDGATILPNMEHFVGLLRKVKRPGLIVQLLERASTTELPELKALADGAKGKLPVESRQSIFHAVAKLEASAQQTVERAAERIMLLEDDYGAQAVQSLLDQDREDDAVVLAMPSDRYKRGADVPIAVLVPRAQIKKRLNVERIVAGRIPRLSARIEKQLRQVD